MDCSKRGFKHTAIADSFLFEENESSAVKLKRIPIEFRWRCQDEAAPMNQVVSPEKMMILTEMAESSKEKDRWFRAPPKVQVVKGILRRSPQSETCGEC